MAGQGEIVARRESDGRVVIESAPPVVRMSLELVAAADPVAFIVRGPEIRLAGQVTYRVTGWDDHSHCLLLEKVEGI